MGSKRLLHAQIFIILQPFGLQVVPAPTPQQDTQIIDAYIRQSSG
jgi:hypothetical protein